MSTQPSGRKFSYDEYARTRPPDDFWGQVLRTVQGVPVPEDQIERIVAAICTGLNFEPEDVLLDIACGNGALSQRLFGRCAGFLGVDLSQHLISVARTNFEKLPNFGFLEVGAGDYVTTETSPKRFTKVLCYGSFQYLSENEAIQVLRTLYEKFTRVRRCFIGNLPDRDHAADFYKRTPGRNELSNHETATGCWRTRQEFEYLVRQSGWKVSFSTMPPEFYASYYRYDALLMRDTGK
ncbi:MAG: methyltransferase domain-containing protein [Ferrovum sp.]|jgi:cyclopropane fatty-acyl-phospholipid synthase-like methyltransferase|uniref:methyltransferase domain-containing protein n=1 Tax=Ferrovum sp. TaxID=2609467 RepID=UPI001D3501AD|nr:class I SAM-dependent methyltransferase [Ferrovum sp.]MBW8028554.1 methyltransferase domain-containing protein [Ferrovum sp.]MBW8068236.1 methyltransferase domain-containing protein [Ferrovum sp.]